MLSDELTVCLILTAPLYAAFTSMLFPVGRIAVALAGAVWLGAATWFLLQVEPKPSLLVIGSWLGASVEPSLAVKLQFQFDTTTAITLGTAGLMLALASSLIRREAPPESSGAGPGTDTLGSLPVASSPKLLFLLFLCGVACLATDLIVVVMAWLLLDVTLVQHLETSRKHVSASPLKPLQISSLLLIGVLALTHSRHETTQLGDIYKKATANSQVDAASARALLGSLVALAIGLRAALLPGVLWLRRTFDSARPAELLVIPLATQIPATALLLRLGYVVRVDPQPVLLCAGIAAAASAIAAAFAVAQRRPVAGLLLVQTALFADAAAMFCSKQPVPAFPLHFFQVATVAGFGIALLATKPGTWHQHLTWAFLVVALTSFYYGSPFTVDAAWNWSSKDQLQTFVQAALAATQLLLPIAMLRCLSHKAKSEVVFPVALIVSLPLLVGFIGVTLVYFARKSAIPMIPLNPWPIAGTAIGTLAVLKREHRARAHSPAQPAIHFLEECGHVERLYKWLVSMPVRLVSRIVETFDRHLMGGSKEGTWLAHYSNLAEHATHLRDLDPRYTALAAVLCLAGILLALTSTGS